MNRGPVHVWRYLTAVLIVVGIVASLASNLGVCVSEGRILSSSDYFKGAIDVVIRDPVDGVAEQTPGATTYKSVHSQKYSDADKFISENPDCCKLIAANSGDGGPETSILDRIAGMHTVEVSYDKRYADEVGAKKSSKVTGKVAVTSCGKGRPYR